MAEQIKVLLVEDSDDDVQLIKRIFDKSDFGFSMKKVETLSEFTNELDNFIPDVILSDYMLPDCNGLDIIRKLKASQKDIPLIIVSGAIGEEVAVEAMKSGANDYVMKQNLFRLVPAIKREIQEAKLRREKKIIDEKYILFNTELEKKVAERTLELGKINAKLQQEIIERTKAENNLEKSENRFVQLFKASPVAMSIVRASDSVVLDINDSYLGLLGLERDEVLGHSPRNMQIWENVEERDKYIDYAMNVGTIKNQEIRLLNKQKQVKTVLMSIEYMTSKDFEPWLLFITQDISEIKQAEDEIKNALAKEKDLNVFRVRLISMISHEFRTPLTTIMLSADLLKNFGYYWTDEERNKHFSRIQNTILSLTQLIEKVLAVGRMENGRFEFNPENIDLQAFCKSTVENIQIITITNNPIVFNFDYEDHNAEFDENLLGLILTNIISNAIKYSPNNTKIEFDVKSTDKSTLFSVKDHGIGIPKNELNQLFETFYRASNVGTISGYGLGLSIVASCVEAHKGKIYIESEENIGTTFTVEIPKKF